MEWHSQSNHLNFLFSQGTSMRSTPAQLPVSQGPRLASTLSYVRSRHPSSTPLWPRACPTSAQSCMPYPPPPPQAGGIYTLAVSPGDLLWGPEASGVVVVGGGAGEGLALSKSSRAPSETRDIVFVLEMNENRRLEDF